MSSMECQRTQDLLSDYIDGILMPHLGAFVETHVSHCDGCRRDLAQMRRTVATLRALPPMEPPSYFVHAVQAQISRRRTPPQRSMPQWLYPNRQGFAVRLLAAAILIAALFPPVRQTVGTATWSIVSAIGVSKPKAETKPDTRPDSTSTTTANTTAPAPGKAASAPTDHSSIKPDSAPAAASGAQPAAVAPPAAPPSTLDNSSTNPLPEFSPVVPITPIQKPPVSDVLLRFRLDGDRQVGSLQHLTVDAITDTDIMDATVVASVSPGASFATEAGTTRETQRKLLGGPLLGGTPNSSSTLIVASAAGLYDLHVEVHTSQGTVGASDLFIPVGVPPTTIGIETKPGSSTDMYTALSTLASQSGKPVAVEDGLKGTTPLIIHPKNLEAGVQTVATAYGCTAYDNDGIFHVVLHPERLPGSGKVGA